MAKNALSLKMCRRYIRALLLFMMERSLSDAEYYRLYWATLSGRCQLW